MEVRENEIIYMIKDFKEFSTLFDVRFTSIESDMISGESWSRQPPKQNKKSIEVEDDSNETLGRMIISGKVGGRMIMVPSTRRSVCRPGKDQME